ncbi:MAG: DUF1614 domain-containing protein [Cyanophyceae cyanobacterium]
MIYFPVPPFLFFLFLLLFPCLWLASAVGVIEILVAKLSFSPGGAFAVLTAMLMGSTINIPLYRVPSAAPLIPDIEAICLQQFWGIPLQKVGQQMVVALNVGGGLIAPLLAIYVLTRSDAVAIVSVGAIVTAISYLSAQIVPAIGVQINAMIPPLTAAISAVLIAEPLAPSVTFAGGILGTLIGADLLHLKKSERSSTGILSIGGAGVFDSIAICTLFALLLT